MKIETETLEIPLSELTVWDHLEVASSEVYVTRIFHKFNVDLGARNYGTELISADEYEKGDITLHKVAQVFCEAGAWEADIFLNEGIMVYIWDNGAYMNSHKVVPNLVTVRREL